VYRVYLVRDGMIYITYHGSCINIT